MIPGPRRSSGEEGGYPLQYSCPESFMDRGAWQAIQFTGWQKESNMTEQLRLSHFSLHRLIIENAEKKITPYHMRMNSFFCFLLNFVSCWPSFLAEHLFCKRIV